MKVTFEDTCSRCLHSRNDHIEHAGLVALLGGCRCGCQMFVTEMGLRIESEKIEREELTLP